MATNSGIRRLLIANRGEIAARIARAARDEGIAPLGIYSEADRRAPYLHEMERVAPVGPAPATESYLNIERIIAAARSLEADAVHPGYGFLSERAAFARSVAEAGLRFVGPPASAIAAVGDKREAKRHARACNVTVVEGYDGEEQTLEALSREAQRIGFPLIIKATAGGGGRGMRVVARLRDFEEALASAKREALAGFGDDRVLLERYIAGARHIEFQILADAFGRIIHLGERDCSVQRRHQKIVEEAPAPAMTPELRGRMGDAAVRIARSVGYVNAGTVEFLFDENGAFFFLEMNARLQVEHPVTESVYGVDIVRLQLRIAGGEQLALVQRDVVAHGWAIEARVNAENPATSLPVAGTIEEWQMPPLAGVRIDSGVRSGSEVPIEYDALLAKVIASGADRTQALDRLTQALERLVVHGIPTNVPLLLRILRDPVFRAGRATTAFLGERHVLHDDPGAEPLAVWYLAFAALLRDGIGWRIGSVGVPITLLGPQASRSVIASRCANDGHWKIAGDLDVELQFEGAGDEALIVYDGAQRLQGRAWVDRGGVTVRYAEASYRFTFGRLRRREPERADLNVDGRALVTAPMPGRIGRVAVSVGEQVHEGDLLIVLEAMKMEHRIEASRAGRVRAVHVTPGLLVKSGDDLAEIE